MAYDRIIRGGSIVTGEGIAVADIGIADGKIVAVGDVRDSAADTIDARGLHVMPGVIDTQVHFREPGMEHKEDLESGTRAAICGGVTTVFEMPNTNPPTTSREALEDKLGRAAGRAWCDYAFFVGATTEPQELGTLELLPGTPGIKLFVGSSTGTLLVPDDATIERIFRATRRRTPIHSEDHPRLESRKALISDTPHPREHPFLRDAECARLATERVIALARRTGHKVHILHLSTLDEIPLIAETRTRVRDRFDEDLVTVEVTPQHLWFSAEDYERLGSLLQMNPPIRSADHREALREALRSGFFDVIGSDHAPHTLDEKAQPYPASPSGMPGVQTLLPAMLTLCQRDGLIDLATLSSLTSERPAQLYGIEGKGGIRLGHDADLVLVDLESQWRFERSCVQSKCGWSPFEGETFWGRPLVTLLRGEVAMRDGEPVDKPRGDVVRFTT